MKITCPTCQAAVAAADINIQTGMALCRACNEVFAFRANVDAGGLPPATGPVEKPAGTAIEYARTPDGFGVIFPRRSGRGLGIFLIIFGAFWDLVSGGMLVSMLSHSGNNHGSDFPALLLVPIFFIVGAAILLGGLANISMRTALIARARSVLIVRKVFGREFVKAVPVADITDVARVERYEENDVPVYGLGLVLTGGKGPAVGIRLSVEEVAWLRWLILDYRGPVA